MSSILCCGISLATGVRLVAISDIIVEVATIGFIISSLVTSVHDLNCCWWDRESAIAVVSLDTGTLLIHIVEFLIVIVVFQGAQQRSTPKCKIWARLTEVLTGLDGIIFIARMIIKFEVGMLIFMIFDLAYKSYTVAVVEAFVGEMRTYNGIPRSGGTGTGARTGNAEDAFD